MTEAAVLYEQDVARGAESPGALLERYESLLAEAVAGLDDGTLEDAGLDDEAIRAIREGDGADVPVQDAVVAIAAADGRDPDALLGEVRDTLLLTMSTAMLDVDRIAADVDADMDPKEVQGKVEGRHPMTLAEYARINHYVASKAG